MIRHATTQDIPRVVQLAREEHALSRWKGDLFDEACVTATACSYVSDMGRTLLVSDHGYFAGLVQPVGFNPKLIATEFAWFASDGSGMALLHAFEAWGKRMGASRVAVHSFISDRLGKILSRRFQYSRVGSMYSKEL